MLSRLLQNLQKQLQVLQAQRAELQAHASGTASHNPEEESDEDADIDLEGWSTHETKEYKVDQITIRLNCTLELTPYDALLLASFEDEAETEDLTGNRVWLGGMVLLNFIARNRSIFAGKRVIELGSGCGLCGILAATADLASLSVVTDGDPGCVDLISSNITQNEAIVACRCCALYHQWGRQAAQKLVEENEFHDKFDVVMASDVLYAVEVLVPLMESAVELLAPGGTFILANVPRCELATIDEAIREAANMAGLVKQQSVDLKGFMPDSDALQEAIGCGAALFTLAA
jgi:predicted nicotinamide N-methyase